MLTRKQILKERPALKPVLKYIPLELFAREKNGNIVMKGYSFSKLNIPSTWNVKKMLFIGLQKDDDKKNLCKRK